MSSHAVCESKDTHIASKVFLPAQKLFIDLQFDVKSGKELIGERLVSLQTSHPTILDQPSNDISSTNIKLTA